MPTAHDPRASRLADVAARFSVADIYVFGSRADEVASARIAPAVRPDSDVDIAVRPLAPTASPLSPAMRVDLTHALEQALGVSPVDLLVLPEAGAFLALAAVRGHLLYCADAVDQAEYE